MNKHQSARRSWNTIVIVRLNQHLKKMLRVFLRANNASILFRRFAHSPNTVSKKFKEGIPTITPILDFKRRLANPESLQNSLKRRGRTSQFDVEDLVAQWKIYDSIIRKKRVLENQQKETIKLLKEAKTSKQEAVIRKYTLELETIREDLHNFVHNLAEFEETFVSKFLSLPNDIHNIAPEELKIISSHGTASGEGAIHHLAFENAIEYHNETSYFLKGDAAKFDQTFGLHCLNHFRQQHFIQFSNPDFVQTPILEAVGMTGEGFYEVSEKSDDPTKLIHLVGNSSMHAFMGFITRLRVYNSLLPLQWVATGRIYHHIEQNEPSLYDVCQSSVVQVFQAGAEEQMIQQFDDTLKLIFNLFKELDVHFRIVYVPAKELGPAESLAARIEMFSPNSQRYVEVGNLSYYGDYISKRLLFSYVKDSEKKIIDFPHIVSGTVCNLTRILAIILETYNGIVPSNLFKEISIR